MGYILMALILIADSSAQERQKLRTIIEADDHIIVEADNGPYCLEIAEYHHPECVLLSLLGTDKNDIELLQALQQLAIPTIVLTDNAQTDISQQYLELGASRILRPSPESAEILPALAAAVDSGPVFQPLPTAPKTDLETPSTRSSG